MSFKRRSLQDHLVLASATCLFLGYLPPLIIQNRRWTGSGLIGTACGVALLRFLPESVGFSVLVWVLVCAISAWICGRAEGLLGQRDDPRIILDELVGYWVAMAFLPRTLRWMTLSFVLFRIFDVLKLPWGRRAERLPGGWGILADDLVAGVQTNLVLHLVRLSFALGWR